MGISDITYKTASWGEVKADIYSGKNSDEHKPFIEISCDGDMESDTAEEITFDVKRWPVGTKITVEVPCCPTCGLDAEFQNEEGKCECGFDWRNWAEEQYS
ncbi:hypothetical protein [Xenorhabdus bovienii]|uniref:Uncharacterized protein n=1 Tax=Xenorhabdus bovienii str. feltiae Moldova TaxID=1398200 RepID=A0A077NPA2_XENBV|nr:hypothetical protein [Xenorhabdus bovienii]CDG88104.1 conserved hypothetical protein [Xenorhabdus bovienii str. feltiae France]CDG91598.1 conserved hypothetical protein [Xenorhabdus bovienii str. feltiae Florida]CDH00198.1 conserved hypothetical protein [Xenorhabdus bovienii str. feltiae Moldova]